MAVNVPRTLRCMTAPRIRPLSAGEYHALRAQVRPWAQDDRSWADVISEFGTPSTVFGGTSTLYSKTLGYLGEVPDEPMVFFHLWNVSTPALESTRPKLEEPVLLAVRFGDAPFDEASPSPPRGNEGGPSPTRSGAEPPERLRNTSRTGLRFPGVPKPAAAHWAIGRATADRPVSFPAGRATPAQRSKLKPCELRHVEQLLGLAAALRTAADLLEVAEAG